MITASLTATETADGLELALALANDGDEPATLEFRTGQRAEFVAYADGEEAWRYSDGRMFTQVLGSETLAPGESTTYGATWRDPPAGEYRVVGRPAAENVDVEAETTVTVS